MRAAAVLSLALLTTSPFAHAAVQKADTLYSALAHAKTPEDAKQIEDQLHGLWSHSGSPSADLLLQRGLQALNDDDLDTARAILKALTGVSPGFAEGWHMRAEVDLQADDYSDALLALRRALHSGRAMTASFACALQQMRRSSRPRLSASSPPCEKKPVIARIPTRAMTGEEGLKPPRLPILRAQI